MVSYRTKSSDLEPSALSSNRLADIHDSLASAMLHLASGATIVVEKVNNTATDEHLSEQFASQLLEVTQAIRNAYAGINCLDNTDILLNEISSALLRMRELAVQASNIQLSHEKKVLLQTEFNELKKSVTTIAQSINVEVKRLQKESFAVKKINEAFRRQDTLSADMDTPFTKKKQNLH